MVFILKQSNCSLLRSSCFPIFLLFLFRFQCLTVRGPLPPSASSLHCNYYQSIHQSPSLTKWGDENQFSIICFQKHTAYRIP